MSKIALVLGGNGRFGRHCTAAFIIKGWEVRQFRRGKDDLIKATKDVDLIINGWNPQYQDWAKEVPDLTKRVIDAADKSNSTVLIAGNVYVYGKNPGPWNANTQHQAVNALAQVRIDMEAAYRNSHVKTIIMRGGDFIDTQNSNNWFESYITNKIDRGILTYPGTLNTPHSWAYLPDLARACAEIAEIRDHLPTYADIPFSGYTLTGEELRQALNIVSNINLRLNKFPWWAVRLASPFSPLMRSVHSMRYLWDTPHSLDHQPLQKLLPDFQATPLETALKTALSR